MDDQHYRDLRELAATIRLSAHILEQYPEQLYNQIIGRIGQVTPVRNMKPPAKPHLRLVSRSLKGPDSAIVHILVGHNDGVTSCAFSTEGNLLVSASADKKLRVWNVQTGECLRVFEGHTDRVTACAFSPDGQFIVSASKDTTLRQWDIYSAATIHIFTGHRQTVNGCAITPDGRYLLSVSGGHLGMKMYDRESDNSFRLWNLETKICEHIFDFPEKIYSRIDACAVSYDGKLAVTGDSDNNLRLWDLDSKQCIYTVRSWKGSVHACAFVGNRYVLSATADSAVQLWDFAENQRSSFQEPLIEYLGHSDDVTGCTAFARERPEGEQKSTGYILSSSEDNTLRLWDILTGACIRTLYGHTGWVNGCACSYDGKFAASASSDRNVIIWDIDALLTGNPALNQVSIDEQENWNLRPSNLSGHRQPVTCCRFSPDGQCVLTGSVDRTLRLWDVPTQRVIRVFVGHEQDILDCAFSPDGQTLLSASRDGTLRLWNRETAVCERTIVASDSQGVWGCTFSVDGTKIISALSGIPLPSLIIWDCATATKIDSCTNLAHSFTRYTFTRDGRYILSTSREFTLKCLDSASFQELPDFSGLVGPEVPKELQNKLTAFSGPLAMVTSLDATGQRAVTTFSGSVNIVWEIQSGREICHLQNPAAKEVRSPLFSQNSSYILAFTTDRHIRVWNAQNGQEIASWPADDDLLACALHPDSKHMLAGDQSGAVHFLLLDGFQLLHDNVDKNTSQQSPRFPRWQFWKKR